MTYTPDLNISGSPIYEHLVAASGDPYQPLGYELPAVYEQPPGYPQYDATGTATGYGAPPGLSQFLNRMLGDGQSWVAVVVFGGPVAEQFRQFQQFQQHQVPQMPQQFRPAAPYGYADGSGFGTMSAEQSQAAMAQAFQAYQQMMMQQWAAQQQAQQFALPAAGPQPLALTSGAAPQPVADAPPPIPPTSARALQPAVYDGMLAGDWASWLGQTSQSIRPQDEPDDQDDLEVRPEPELSYERRGGRLSSRLGAAMRELRGR